MKTKILLLTFLTVLLFAGPSCKKEKDPLIESDNPIGSVDTVVTPDPVDTVAIDPVPTKPESSMAWEISGNGLTQPAILFGTFLSDGLLSE